MVNLSKYQNLHMRKYFCGGLLIVLFSYCSSVEKHNALIETNLSIDEQLEDVTYLEKKIKKIQPNLYQFITEEALSKKFDSVRKTINKPLKPNEFYFKISPLLASVRQGHSTMSPIIKNYSKQETKEMQKKGLGPVSQFEYKYMENKLFIMNNKSKDSTIQRGTEVVSIENITPQDLFKKYRKTFTSDGYNETFIPYVFTLRFGSFLYYELGLRDSLNFKLKCYDSVYTKLIKRFPDKKEEKEIL